MTSDLEKIRMLYGPTLESMTLSLPDVGLALQTACHELSLDLSLTRIDWLISQLRAAEQNLIHIRKSLASDFEEGKTGRGVLNEAAQ